MSATEDARSTARPAAPPRLATPGLAVILLAGFAPGALVAVALLALPGVLPGYHRFECMIPSPAPALSTTRAGVSARVVHGPPGVRLSLTSADPAAAAELARELVSASVASAAATARRAGARAAWSRAMVIGPLPPLSGAAECAAYLRARAAVARALAGEEPAVENPALPDAPGVRERAESLAASDVAVERAALEADPAALDHALGEADRAEAGWLTAVASALAPDRRAEVTALWRARERADALTLEDEAARLEVGLTDLQLSLVTARVPAAALEREPGVPEAQESIARTASPMPVASPIPEAWAWAAMVGGLAGALLALALAQRPRARRSHTELEAPRRVVRPHEVEAWLHVLSGPDGRRVAGGVATLAANFFAGGERVVVMDAGPALRLHEFFGADPRWGVCECLAGEMPLLGTVQNFGGTGLFLLAHGRSGGGELWARLGRLLEAARPHFDRVVLAVDSAAPHALGESLRGRWFEAWWAGGGEKLPATAAALSRRLGIAFNGLELDGSLNSALELLASSSSGRARAAPTASDGIQELIEPPRAVAPSEPRVLDCDLQVQERLRFLVWMKGIQAEGRRAAPVATADAGAALES